jgi:hypothetical protein
MAKMPKWSSPDPPYNVAIEGNVSGLGKIRHREFMASGEMTQAEFTAFLGSAFANLVAFSCDGSIHFVCMDWRHIGEMLAAGGANYAELKNLIVWAKDNGGMGGLLPLTSRAHLRIQEWLGSAHQQFRARPTRALSDQCLGVPGRQYLQNRAPGRAYSSPHNQAGGDDRRRDQGRVATRRRRPRSVRGFWIHADRDAQDRTTGAALRA